MPSIVRPSPKAIAVAPPPLNTKRIFIEPEQEHDVDLPGTPPIDPLSRRAWGDAHPKLTEARRLVELEKLQPLERHKVRHVAAMVLQRLVRCFLSRRRLAKRLSAVGRPVELQITRMRGLQMLCDFRNIVSLYCNVRVLKKPFGPFMFHFSSSKTPNRNTPQWTDKFLVPMLSSKCDIIITLIGVTSTGKLRFLGQAVVALDYGWESKRTFSVPLGKWKFPVDESIIGLHRFVQGTVELEITPLSSQMPCKSGQFLMAPILPTRTRRAYSYWSRSGSSNKLLSSPAPRTPQKPASASPSRKTMVIRWGMLTDTAFHLFDNTTAKLLTSLDLSTLQFIKSNAKLNSQFFSLKLYAKGKVYVLYLSSYAQQQSWEYRINLHRRELIKLL